MTDPAEDEAEQRAWVRGSALELASTALCAVEPDLSGDIADYDVDYALDVLGMLEALTTATREARRQVSEFIASKLEGVQYYRHRDQIVKVGGSGEWVVRDEVVNDGSLAGYIGPDWPTVVNLKARGVVTKTRIEALGALPEIRERELKRFFKYKRNDSAISAMPPDKAPKKAQALSHGQSIAAEPRLEAGE